MHREKRKHVRQYCSGIADAYPRPDAAPHRARIADLSLEGCLLHFEGAHQLEIGETLEIAFNVNQLPFRVRARVRAVRSAKSLGAQFDSVSGRTERRLAELVEELREDYYRPGSIRLS